uniref:Sulfotransferase domain-containing protein n=1 Tax=Chrysotila carterae TaxID=13221 RepID=A0A7S4B555_CHRCT
MSDGDVEPFSRYSVEERELIFLAGGEEAEQLRKAQLQWRASHLRGGSAPFAVSHGGGCTDTADWENYSGKSCADYASEYCDDGTFRDGMEWTGGPQFNMPEVNCCACGKPSRSELVALDGITEQTDLHALATARIASCDARTRKQAGPFLLNFHRLPRTGNAFMCFLLGACSSKQSRIACADALDSGELADACPGGAAEPFWHYGSERVPPGGHGMCAGLDGLNDACSSYGGDEARTCEYMRSLRLPATALVQHERYVPLELPPCSWPVAHVRMLVMLREPAERAQSAYTFGLQKCICTFSFPWCKMYTSFRFSQRRAVLCDGKQPKHSFSTAVSVLRTHAGKDFPAATADTMLILGRYAASIVKEVYAPYFGGYRRDEASPWLASASLARATLAHCFTWVGIAEEMPLSLALLKAELPQFFGNLNTEHVRAQWASTSTKQDASDIGNHSHPYLRTQLLSNDYAIYDAERARLFRRAAKQGIAVVAASQSAPLRV